MSFDKESYIIGKSSSKDTGGFALKSLLATENGGYHAPAGSAYAYVKVSVDKGIVPEGTLEIAENGNGINVSSYEKVNVNVPQGVFPSGTVQISENGVFDVGSYEHAQVSVTSDGDPYDIVKKLFNRTLRWFSSRSCQLPTSPFYINGGQTVIPQLAFFSVRDNTIKTETRHFQEAKNLVYCNLGNVPSVASYTFYSDAAIETVVITSKTVPTLSNTNAFASVPKLKTIYVADSLIEEYKSASNWSGFESKLKGFSSAPSYDETTEYSIGDVCVFNGKCYAYSKEELASSTGNAPSGTAQDNLFWEYIDETGVTA